MTERPEYVWAPWDRELAPRTAVAWYAMAELLRDGLWHSHDELAAHAMSKSDVSRKTILNILRESAQGKGHGLLRRRRGAKQMNHYRVDDKGLADRPELRVR